MADTIESPSVTHTVARAHARAVAALDVEHWEIKITWSPTSPDADNPWMATYTIRGRHERIALGSTPDEAVDDLIYWERDADGRHDEHKPKMAPRGCASCPHASQRFNGGSGATTCSMTGEETIVSLGHVPPTIRPVKCPLWASGAGDTVDHPDHYGGAGNPYETIKVIEAWGLGFALGNAVKYISRCDAKGRPVEDLEKARWYLDREIGARRAGPDGEGAVDRARAYDNALGTLDSALAAVEAITSRGYLDDLVANYQGHLLQDASGSALVERARCLAQLVRPSAAEQLAVRLKVDHVPEDAGDH